ncbi:MAG: autoinducer binding domain-containing protein [Vitreoscilla sp.]|nr:autoinducer binding domain-containing protein [Vitreoscilla sp.]
MQLQNFFDVSQSADKTTFRRRLIDFAHAMDFGLVSSVLVVERPGSETDFLYVGNRPEDFASLSADKDISKKDPVLTQLRTHGLPFLYDQKFYVQAGAPELWERAAPYGYRTGISVALRLPGNKQFLLGLDRERPLPRSEQKITRMLADLQLLAVHCQDAAQRLLTPEPPKTPAPTLTPREREVLLRSMEGKSAWATGQLLGMSEHTVNFHLRNIFRKLDASSKQVAVLKAISLGLIKQ